MAEEDFTRNVQEFSENAKKIKVYADELKVLRKRQKELKSPICVYMKEAEAEEVKLEGCESKIKYTESKRVKPINKEMIKETLVKLFDEKMNDINMMSVHEKAKFISEWIYYKDNREYSTSDSIKSVEL